MDQKNGEDVSITETTSEVIEPVEKPIANQSDLRDWSRSGSTNYGTLPKPPTKPPSMPSGASFMDKYLGFFIPMFVILSGLGFMAKVQQGWSMGEWFRTEVSLLIFCTVFTLIVSILGGTD